MSLIELRKSLHSLADSKKAKLLQGFFKTGPGEYGEGDVFLGVVVPKTREVAKKFSGLSLKDTESLLKSKIHEERLCALLLLVHNYEKYPEKRTEIFNFYLKNTTNINNWDLVDLSAPKITGHYLYHNSKDTQYKVLLTKLAKSDNIWERRIAILTTFYFIKYGKFEDSLALSEMLLHDKHDLMHKAVGWMLREIGKKDQSVLESFLKLHYKTMPRTMLRYAIERFPQKLRKMYLHGKI